MDGEREVTTILKNVNLSLEEKKTDSEGKVWLRGERTESMDGDRVY